MFDRNILPNTNIFVPENQWLEDEFPVGMAHLQVLCWFQGGYPPRSCRNDLAS